VVSVQPPRLRVQPRACQAARDALQPRHDRDDSAPGARLGATAPASDPATLVERLVTLQREHTALCAQEAVDSAVDLCQGRGCRADQQRDRACLAAGGAVAQGQLRVRQRGGQSICRTTADGGNHLPAARAVAAGLPGGGGGGGAPRNRSAIVAPDATEVGEHLPQLFPAHAAQIPCRGEVGPCNPPCVRS
jgi:hypothetical protein